MKSVIYLVLGMALILTACAEEKNSDDVCSDPALAGPHIRNTRQMILRDEGNELLHRVNLNAPATNWTVEIPKGRDLQLVGKNRVMIGTEDGYQEHNLTNGAMVDEVTNYPGTISARRLRNGNTLLAISQSLSGFSLVEVNAAGKTVHTIEHTDRSYVRLVRETPQGTYLVTSNSTILELDETGTVLWEATVNTDDPPHAWQALRLATGETIVSCGYAANMQLFSADGQYIESLQSPLSTTPSFYSGFQIMNDGKDFKRVLLAYQYTSRCFRL